MAILGILTTLLVVEGPEQHDISCESLIANSRTFRKASRFPDTARGSQINGAPL